MNKMNLPPPFDEDAIPGRFSLKQEQEFTAAEIRGKNRKRPRTNESMGEQFVEEEDDDDSVAGQNAVADDQIDTPALEVHPPQMPQSSKHTEDNLLVKCSSTDANLRTELIGKPLVRHNKLSAVKTNAALSGAFQLEAESDRSPEMRQLTRPGVISKNEVDRQRVSPEASYSRGLSSNIVWVKNIARGLDEKDLRFVFGYVLPLDSALECVIVCFLL
ncbi:unnamed protein product [Phytophthora fragariaefolia]|uniref:Unnamed protein product n=1 Tax=Phytophthora fragariaefolia TaxID=1490495 RepID=A0A9W6TXZ5_9STRA|nr:unnamed protein product [Phytophthora fragariaefolia]